MEIMKEAEDETDAESVDAPTNGTASDAADDAPPPAYSEYKGPQPADSTPHPTTDEKKPYVASPRPQSATETLVESPARSQSSTPRPKGVPTRHLLMPSEESAQAADGLTEAERELRRREKKKAGLSEEQRKELAAYENERKKVRQERVDNLTRKLVDRISVWTETDKGPETTHAFNEKTKYEVENLKMESFGIDILHCWYPHPVLHLVDTNAPQRLVPCTSPRAPRLSNRKSFSALEDSLVASRIREPSSKRRGAPFPPPLTRR